MIKCHYCQKEVDINKHHLIEKTTFIELVSESYYYHPDCFVEFNLNTFLTRFKEKKIKELNEMINHIKNLEL